MILKSDCRHFPGDRPCQPNKEFGQTCPDCPHYETQGHRILIIKLAALGLAYYCWRMGRRSLLLRINILFAILVSWNLFALIARVVDMA